MTTTTREAALEAALKLARNRLQACAIDHPTGSREMAERSEWADEATAALSTPATEPQGLAHIVDYTNWRGETARRVIRPIRMWWGKTEWHPEKQWMLTAWDCEKNAVRDFAWQDMRPVQNPATSAAALAARPAPQPAADTRVVTKLTRRELAVLKQIVNDHRDSEAETNCLDGVRVADRILAKITAIIGTAQPDKIELATRLIITARAEWLAENDPKDCTDCVTPYDEWFYK